MPTTELLIPPVGDDSKPVSRPGIEQPTLPAKRDLPGPKQRKWLWAASAVVLLAVAATFYFRGSGQPVYVTAAVDRGDIEAAITATGSVNAVTTVQVGSQVSGNIMALYADFNTKVKAGQLVARIDPAIFQARVDQARAAVDSARASVVSANASIAKAASDIAGAEANV